MKIHVRNYRALTAADLELAPLALVATHNEGGKTSLAHAVASVLLGSAVVMEGAKASEAGALVHAGAAKAELSIEGPGGSATLNIPPGKPASRGERPPRASRYALGLDSVVWLDAKERARVLLEYLKTAPTKDDLAKALSDPRPQYVDKLWEHIEQLGWDGAHERAQHTGAKLKGQWEGITSDRYGSAKAGNWVPEGWSEDLASASLESLEGELNQAKEFLEAAIAGAAVSAEERARLKTLVGNIDVLKGRVAEQEAEVRRAAAAEERERLAPSAGKVSELEKLLKDQRAELKKAEKVSERKAIETHASGAAGARERIKQARTELETRQTASEEAQARRKALGDLGDSIELPEGTVGPCPHCRKPVLFCDGHLTIPPTEERKRVADDAKGRREKIANADETVERCKKRVQEIERNLGALEADLAHAEEAEAKLKKMPAAECALSVEEAQRAVGSTEIDLQRARQAAERLSGLPKVEATAQTHAEASRFLGQLQAELKEVQDAQAKLAALPAEVEGGRDVNHCKESLRLAETRSKVWRQKTDADRTHANIALNQEFVGLLAPTGVRQQKLAEKVGEFNGNLKGLCKLAGWKLVELDAETLTMSYGGYQYRWLSDGAKYRVRTILQIAMAQMDGSDLFICDGADILDSGPPLNGVTRGRPGLFKLLIGLGLPALVLMTAKGKEEVPDLTKVGVSSYWIEEGTVNLLAQAAPAQAAQESA